MKILKVTKQPELHLLLRRYIFRKTNFELVMKNSISNSSLNSSLNSSSNSKSISASIVKLRFTFKLKVKFSLKFNVKLRFYLKFNFKFNFKFIFKLKFRFIMIISNETNRPTYSCTRTFSQISPQLTKNTQEWV